MAKKGFNDERKKYKKKTNSSISKNSCEKNAKRANCLMFCNIVT